MNEITKRRLFIFLILAFSISWLSALVIFLTGGLSDSPELIDGTGITLAIVLEASVYMWGPAIANLLTRIITKEGWENSLVKVQFKKSWPYWMAAWFSPAILSILGAVIFFVIFPRFFDADMTFLKNQLAQTGMLEEYTNLYSLIILQTITAVFLSPVLNFVATFGEEFGWRGYLLPKLSAIGKRKALLLSSAIWGVWHWPVVWMGHNYGLNYWGYPWLGLLATVWFTLSIGVFFGWLAQKGESIWPAVIAHAALNGIASLGLLFAQADYPSILGPSPAGVIGVLPFTIISLVIIAKTKD